MSKGFLSRRAFLQTTASVAGASLIGGSAILEEPAYAADQAVAASDRVRFGIVGVGMEGSGLLTTAIQLPGVECVAAADLYDGRHELAKEIVGKPIRTTRRYQDLLDAKDIDAIIVAVPDHWHKQVVVDAIAAGKDVYCEKPMSHNPADGLAMLAASKKSDRIVQIGAQRTSSVICAKAKELYDKGAIGDINLIEMTLGRNDPTGAWEYPPPPDLSPQTLDWETWQGTAPKKAFDPLAFARWRCWKEYGTGVAGDLMVHLISGMQFVLGINEVPTARHVLRRHLSLEGWPQHAGCAAGSLRIHGHSRLHAPLARLRVHGGHALPGIERRDRNARIQRQLLAAARRRPGAQLLHRLLPGCV